VLQAADEFVLSVKWNNLLFRWQCYGRCNVLHYYISIACACTILFLLPSTDFQL